MSADDPDTTAWKAFAAAHTADEIFDADIPVPAGVAPETLEALIKNVATMLEGHSFGLRQGEHHEEVATRIIDESLRRLSAPVPPADGAIHIHNAILQIDAYESNGQIGRKEAANLRAILWNLPSGTGVAEPVATAQMIEYARRLNDIATDCEIAAGLSAADWRGHASDLYRIAEQIGRVALPTVRGDLETIARIIDPGFWGVADEVSAKYPGSLYPTELTKSSIAKAAAILSLPVQSSAPVDVDVVHEEGFIEGVNRAVMVFAKLLDAQGWHAADGSEDHDTDLGNTFLNILAAKGLYDEETAEFAALSSAPEATVSACAPETIVAGIAHFGLAADGSDLRDLLAAIVRLRTSPQDVGREATIEAVTEWFNGLESDFLLNQQTKHAEFDALIKSLSRKGDEREAK